MRWPFRRCRRKPPTTGIVVRGGRNIYVGDNHIEGFDRGVHVSRAAGSVTVVRNIVRRGPRSRRDWAVIATLVLTAAAVVVAVLAWLLPVG